MSKVVCFGEIMLRLSPLGYQRILQANSFGVVYGGTESNVAVSLSCFGEDAAYLTRLPQNPVADACVNELKRYGVNTSLIVRGGERIGVYYFEKGSNVRPSKVIYDRKHSSFSESSRSDYDWEMIFKGAEWFHFTGITLALDDNMALIIEDACKCAKKLGLTISCDINYRGNLWSSEKAGRVMSPLMKYVDLVIVGEDEAEKVFGIKSDVGSMKDGSDDVYVDIMKKLTDKFGFKKVTIVNRDLLPTLDHTIYAYYYEDNKLYKSKIYTIRIIDQLGAGDAYTAGIIYTLVNKWNPKDSVEFATAAAALKHTIEGDANLVTLSEVKSLAASSGNQITQR